MTNSEAPTTTTRVFGRCVSCKVRFVVQDVTMVPVIGRSPVPSDNDFDRMFALEYVDCPKSGHDINPANGRSHMIKWNYGVKATLSPATLCSAKCHESLSPTCKCSCGGAEHGSQA